MKWVTTFWTDSTLGKLNSNDQVLPGAHGVGGEGRGCHLVVLRRYRRGRGQRGGRTHQGPAGDGDGTATVQL